MLEFFRGWKRKVGCVTLLMSCILTAGWVRSPYIQDRLSLYRSQSHEVLIESKGGNFVWASLWFHIPTLLMSGITMTSDEEILSGFQTFNIQWSRKLFGGGIGTGSTVAPFGNMTFCIIPYWFAVIPLTLLSAWLLLLSKPRARIETPIIEEPKP